WKKSSSSSRERKCRQKHERPQPGGRRNEKCLDYLAQRAAQLFRFAHRLPTADDVRGGLGVLFLDISPGLRRVRNGNANARRNVYHEQQRAGQTAAAVERERDRRV